MASWKTPGLPPWLRLRLRLAGALEGRLAGGWLMVGGGTLPRASCEPMDMPPTAAIEWIEWTPSLPAAGERCVGAGVGIGVGVWVEAGVGTEAEERSTLSSLDACCLKYTEEAGAAATPSAAAAGGTATLGAATDAAVS